MKKTIIILAIFLSLAGCGPKLIYPNLDWLIPWYVSDYISLDAAQRSLLEERLIHFLSWHCRTQLPAYADTLRLFAGDLKESADSIDDDVLNFYYLKFRQHWRELIVQIGPDLADLLMTASDEQVQELLHNLDKQNHKFRKEFVDISQQAADENRQKRMTKSLKRWISWLTPEQKLTVADWSRSLKPIATDWLHDRQLMVESFRHLIAERKTATDFKEVFIDRLAYPERMRSQVYQMKIDYNSRQTIQFLVKLNQLLTAKQRLHLTDKIGALADDLEELSCDPMPASDF
jgi:hypothetical protein